MLQRVMIAETKLLDAVITCLNPGVKVAVVDAPRSYWCAHLLPRGRCLIV